MALVDCAAGIWHLCESAARDFGLGVARGRAELSRHLAGLFGTSNFRDETH